MIVDRGEGDVTETGRRQRRKKHKINSLIWNLLNTHPSSIAPNNVSFFLLSFGLSLKRFRCAGGEMKSSYWRLERKKVASPIVQL